MAVRRVAVSGDAPSYSGVTLLAGDGITRLGYITQAELQARTAPKTRATPPVTRRAESAYPTVPKRTRQTWHPKRGRRVGKTMEEGEL